MRRRRREAIALVALWLVFSVPLVGAEEPAGVVNINTASAEQLTLLPRVGPALAERIIDYREANGRFKTTEELILVRGIGEGTYQLLEPFVTVQGSTTLKEEVRAPRREDEA